MNRYKVEISTAAAKKIRKLDRETQRLVLSYIDRNLHNSKDPRAAGKALKGPLKSLWRYRIGSYRLLAEIKDGELLVIAVDVGHRSEIYSGRGR